MTYPISNQTTQTVPQNDPNFDDGDYSQFDEDSGSDNTDQYTGDSSPAGNMSARDLRTRADALKTQLEDSSLIRSDRKSIQAQLDALENQIDEAQALPPKQCAEKMAAIQGQLGSFETKILGIDGSEDLPGGWGDDNSDPSSNPSTQPDVNSQKLQDLLTMVQNGERSPEENSTLNKDKCIQILTDALQDFSEGKTKAATTGYSEVLDALGGDKDPKEVMTDVLGETPSKVDGNNINFDGKENSSLDLKSPGTGKNVVVDNATEVQLTPKDGNDTVTVAEDGGYYVVNMGKDTFKINKDADLHINSDHVTGDLDNSDGKITVGASDATTQKYISPDQLKDMADKISTAANGMEFGTETAGEDGDYGEANIAPKSKYGMADSGESGKKGTEDAKQALNALADALREPDPKKRKDAMDNATDVLSRVLSETPEAGRVNNTSQLIFDVLYGEMGETGFKQALSSGLIPQDFAIKLSSGLTADPNENKSRSEIDGYQIGGPGWNHETSSDFLNENSGAKGSSSAPPAPKQ